jgi:dihydroorotase
MKIQPQHNIHIQNGHVFDPSQNLDGIMDIFIENDAIVSLGTAPQGFTAEETIDASGKTIFPGFVDLHCFLAEPGYTQKGSIVSETHAAARTGFTTICSTPNSKPVVDSSAVANLIQDKAQQAGYCRVLPLGALTAGLEGEQLSNMHGLKESGCVALSQMAFAFKDSRVIKQCFHYAAGFNITVMVTPLDHALAQSGCMHEGATSTKLGLAGVSESAETVALAHLLILAKETGVKLHISRVTSSAALKMIEAAREEGLNITADVALANLVFTDTNCLGYDSLMHVTPVLRSEVDRQALLAAVNAGKLSICSNHMPHETAGKMAPFAASESGVSVLDTFTQVLLGLIEKGELEQSKAIAAVTSLPAQQLSLSVGTISVEGKADLVILDSQANTTFTESDLISKGHNNPWLHQSLKGKVSHTLNAGHIVYQCD